MRAALKGDKARHDMTRLSKMGLMEIARQRLKSAKMSTTYTSCPSCEGYGLIKNLEVAGLAALRKLQTRSARGDIGRIRMALPPDVATWVLNNKRDDLVQTERRQNLRIEIELRPRLMRHEVELETFARPAAEAGARPEPAAAPPEPAAAAPVEKPIQPESPVVAEPATAPDASPTGEQQPAAAEKSESAAPERRRRRRRRRKPDKGTESPTEDSSVVPFTPVADSQAATEAPTEPDTVPERTESGEGPPKRKRRRRGRRSRPSDAGEAVPAKIAEEPPVPARVRSDELMPAAVGGAKRAKRSRPDPASRRRRNDRSDAN